MRKNYRWFLYLLALVVFLWAAGGLASSPAFAEGLLQEGGGRDVTAADWSGRIPLALAATAVAIIVDALFIVWLVRSRKSEQAGK